MLNKDNVLQVVNSEGVTFNVRLVFEGNTYGRNGCITHDESDPMIEFYDTRYDFSDWEGLGQFVSRYYFSTLDERKVDSKGESYGLQLDSGSDSWYVDGKNIDEVLGWADYKLGGR